MKKVLSSLPSFTGSFLFIYALLGVVWAKSAYGKLMSGDFAQNLGMILGKTVGKNPHGWYKSFLQTSVIPSGELYGNLVLWGECLTALGLLTGVLICMFNPEGRRLGFMVLLGGLIGSFLLNTNFYFAFGWSSPSTETLNLFMMGISAIGIVSLFRVLQK